MSRLRELYQIKYFLKQGYHIESFAKYANIKLKTNGEWYVTYEIPRLCKNGCYYNPFSYHTLKTLIIEGIIEVTHNYKDTDNYDGVWYIFSLKETVGNAGQA